MARNRPQPWLLSVVAGRIEHMIETLAGPGAGEVEDLSASAVLSAIRAQRVDEERAAAAQLVLAAQWADLHPPESIHDAAAFTVPGCEHEEPIAGEGAPLVAEFCVAELGTVLGVSTTAAKKLVGHALELRHRLPRLWAQVQCGRVPAWRARAVAEVTIHSTPALTVEAAGFVDAQVAAVAGRIGQAQLDRLVAETIKRFDLAAPDRAADPEDGHLYVDPRHVSVDTQDVHFAGTMRMEAELDIADMLDLERRVAHDAATQAALGSDRVAAGAPRESARRPRPYPDRARPPHPGRRRRTRCRRSTRRPRGRPPRPLRCVPRRTVHCVRADRPHGGRPAAGAAGPGQGLVRRLPDEGHHQAGDRPQRRSRHTGATRSPTGSASRSSSATAPAFPVVHPPGPGLRHRPRHRVRPRRRGRGPTTTRPTQTDNLAALCRFHHRLKTHTAWRYRMAEPGVFEWTSPHGHPYRRDRTAPPRSTSRPPDPPDIPRPRRR